MGRGDGTYVDWTFVGRDGEALPFAVGRGFFDMLKPMLSVAFSHCVRCLIRFEELTKRLYYKRVRRYTTDYNR